MLIHPGQCRARVLVSSLAGERVEGAFVGSIAFFKCFDYLADSNQRVFEVSGHEDSTSARKLGSISINMRSRSLPEAKCTADVGSFPALIARKTAWTSVISIMNPSIAPRII